MSEQFYTVKQVSEMLFLSEKTVRDKIAEGKIKAYKPAKQWLISSEDLKAYLETKSNMNQSSTNDNPQND